MTNPSPNAPDNSEASPEPRAERVVRERVGGPGWGGPPKGASTAPKSLRLFQPGNPGDPSKWPMTELRQKRKEFREAQAEEVLDRMYTVAVGQVEALPGQVHAQTAFLARVLGEPPKEIKHSGEIAMPEQSPIEAARRVAFLLAAGAAASAKPPIETEE